MLGKGARAPARMLTAVSLVLLSCTADEAEPAGGSYALVRFDGQALPVDGGPLPRRCGPFAAEPCDPFEPPVCHNVLTEGTLSLDAPRGRYDLFYLHRSSCDASVLSLSHDTGWYDQNGRSLTFRAEGNRPITYPGAVEGSAVAMELYGEEDLRFERSRGRAADPVEGAFPLIALRREALPVAGVPPPEEPSSCTVLVDDGLLSLEPVRGREPATGRFRLSYTLVDSCTGAPTSCNEQGTYEQVVSTLVFIGEVSPNVVHLFRGSVEPTEIVLHGGGANDLIFRR